MKKALFSVLAVLMLAGVAYAGDTGNLTTDLVVKKPGKTYDIGYVLINPDAQSITTFISYLDADNGVVATEEHRIVNTPASCTDGTSATEGDCVLNGGTWILADNDYTQVIGTQSTAAGQNCAARLRNAIIAKIKLEKGW